jgi:hypothetical protein
MQGSRLLAAHLGCGRVCPHNVPCTHAGASPYTAMPWPAIHIARQCARPVLRAALRRHWSACVRPSASTRSHRASSSHTRKPYGTGPQQRGTAPRLPKRQARSSHHVAVQGAPPADEAPRRRAASRPQPDADTRTRRSSPLSLECRTHEHKIGGAAGSHARAATVARQGRAPGRTACAAGPLCGWAWDAGANPIPPAACAPRPAPARAPPSRHVTYTLTVQLPRIPPPAAAEHGPCPQRLASLRAAAVGTAAPSRARQGKVAGAVVALVPRLALALPAADLLLEEPPRLCEKLRLPGRGLLELGVLLLRGGGRATQDGVRTGDIRGWGRVTLAVASRGKCEAVGPTPRLASFAFPVLPILQLLRPNTATSPAHTNHPLARARLLAPSPPGPPPTCSKPVTPRFPPAPQPQPLPTPHDTPQPTVLHASRPAAHPG